MAKRKKVAIFLIAFQGGGAERVVSLLLESLKDEFDIHLVVLSPMVEYSLPEGQKLFSFDQPLQQNTVVKLYSLFLLAWRYKKFCRANKIDISLSFLNRPNFINCLSKILGSRSKVIISERTYVSEYLKSLSLGGRTIGKVLTRSLYPKADLIIPNSLLSKMDLEKNFGVQSRFQIIHNPLNVASIRTLKELPVKNDFFQTFTFIHVGGFRPEKNHRLLVEAFSNLKDLDCQLALVGKGTLEKSIRENVAALGLTEKVMFLDFDTNPFKYLSRSGAFVLCSNFEGFPNTILEALACGLPVISTDCRSGPREILAPGANVQLQVKGKIEIVEHGILVPVGDAERLAEAMRRIFLDEELQKVFREKNKQRALDFDLTKIAAQFQDAMLNA